MDGSSDDGKNFNPLPRKEGDHDMLCPDYVPD